MALEGGSILATFLKASSETVFCDKWIRGDDLCVAMLKSPGRVSNTHGGSRKTISAVSQ